MDATEARVGVVCQTLVVAAALIADAGVTGVVNGLLGTVKNRQR